MAKRIVGRYEIERGIGQGGMAAVYLARQLDLDRLVALKELRALKTFDPSVAQRFLREARLAGSLSHPNIVTVYEYFEAGGVPYIAMEYLPRGSLRPYMRGLTLAHVGGVLEGVLAGLGQAERHGIVHRDIKPENLLLTGEGRVKIADFGIAKPANALEASAQMTAAGLTVGTPNYMAPEQAMARELGPWTDLYSVGITTFEMLVGRTPFADTPEPMAVVMRQVNEPVPRVHDVAPQVDEWISDWVAWLVSKAPAERPQSAAQAWDAFEEALIATLGPRWRRDARLLQRGGQTAPTMRKRVAAPVPGLARTAPPRRALAKTTPAAQPQPRRRRRGTSLAAASLVAALIGLGGAGVKALGGGGAAPQPAPIVPSTPAAPVQASVTTSPSVPAATTTAATVTATTQLAKQVAPARALARQYQQAAANQPSGTDPQLLAALDKIAQSYNAAAAAAARNDAAGYNAAVSTAAARTSALTTSTSSQTAPAPQPTQPSGAPNASPCAGDSSSDDPSDDSCSGP